MSGWPNDHLFTATSKKQLENAIQNALNKGDSLEDEIGIGTPLIYHASKGHSSLVEVLLENGAEINAISTRTGNNAVIAAATNGHTKTIEVLLDNDADINAITRTGNNAVIEAAINGHSRTLSYLLGRGGRFLRIFNRFGDTALIAAVKADHPSCVKVLLERGANPNNIDRDGYSVLSCSARYGFTSIAKTLLDYGADLNIHDVDYVHEYGKTPLIHACQQGHIDVVKLLVEYGVNIEDPDNDGFTPMYYAILHNYNNIVKVLLEHGASMNQDYLNPLQDDTVFETLLSSGLDVSETSDYHRNKSPYRIRMGNRMGNYDYGGRRKTKSDKQIKKQQRKTRTK